MIDQTMIVTVLGGLAAVAMFVFTLLGFGKKAGAAEVTAKANEKRVEATIDMKKTEEKISEKVESASDDDLVRAASKWVRKP